MERQLEVIDFHNRSFGSVVVASLDRAEQIPCMFLGMSWRAVDGEVTPAPATI